MGKIIRNGVSYGGSNGPVTAAGLAARAVMDAKGNNIEETYMRAHDVSDVKDFQRYSMKNAGAHNCIFMGRDLTERFESGDIYDRISDGSFYDLFIGDYFRKVINEKEMTCRFAGFNIYHSRSNTQKNHAVMVTDEYFMTAKMNETNTTEGAYAGSQLRQTQIPLVNDYLVDAFGESHLFTIRDFLTTEVDNTVPSGGFRGWNTCSSNGKISDSLADLMSEVEVYGTRVWSSSPFDVGIAKTQLPLFALAPEYINPGRFSWWLRGVMVSSYWCIAHGDNMPCIWKPYTATSVRPRWCIC